MVWVYGYTSPTYQLRWLHIKRPLLRACASNDRIVVSCLSSVCFVFNPHQPAGLAGRNQVVSTRARSFRCAGGVNLIELLGQPRPFPFRFQRTWLLNTMKKEFLMTICGLTKEIQYNDCINILFTLFLIAYTIFALVPLSSLGWESQASNVNW